MIKENITKILEDINNIKIKNSINYNINLMAVTKTFPVEYILEAVDCGIRLFGENRVLEAYEKYNNEQLKNKNIDLHIIGHLQRNKIKEAIQIASTIQSIDKIETLIELEKNCQNKNKKINYLIEVNTSNEIQKFGVYPENLQKFLDQIQNKNFKYCNLIGLMSIGPNTSDTKLIRNSFRLLKNLFDKMKIDLNKDDFNILSMGMSSDYQIAIEEGSNLIRIGSKIFGNR